MIGQKVKKPINWPGLILIFAGFLVLSVGLGYLIRLFLANFKIPLDLPTWLALLAVFGILLVMNLSFLPLPFGISIMFVAASHWNPILVALAGSAGASLGEFNGYLFGYLGKKIAIHQDTPGYQMVHGWIRKYGMWAIAFLSFQPVIPFELGGFIAGVAKMPVVQFLPAIWIGKFPKYLILIFLGNTLIHFFPRFHF
jgi:membrane protein YqaA with SNARE-associated domain